MNGKWILSVKDGEMVSLSDAFCPTWHNQGLFLKYSPLCLCRPIFVDIGYGILQALLYSTVRRAVQLAEDTAVYLVMQITKTTTFI